MIEIQPIQRVDMAQRVDQVRRRITEIEEKIGIAGDFQATLEREIAKYATMTPVKPPQAVDEIQKPDEKISLPQNSTPPTNSPTPPPTNSPATINPLTPPPINQQPPQIQRREIPDVEPTEPTRDEKIFDYSNATPVEEAIVNAAYEYNVDPQLVRAIAIAESDMNQDEISPAGAIGVMQLLPETAAGLGVNPYDRDENIDGGTRYLRQMLDTFDGNVPLAVAAYNAGPNAVKRYGGIPPYAETQAYVGRVLDLVR